LESNHENNWRRKPLRLLVVVLMCGFLLKVSGVQPLDWLYSFLAIEKMPWQR